MDLAEFREYCLTKAGASEETPFGPDVLVFKVGRKNVRVSGSRRSAANCKLEMRSRFSTRPAGPVRASQALGIT